MIPLLLFLLASFVVYLGVVETAFSALMRLSLRLMAERSDRSDRLGRYLDDPILLFVPARLLLGVALSIAAALVVRLVWSEGVRDVWFTAAAMAGIVILCQHLIPALIVRRNPEKVLNLLLPSFDAMTQWLRPIIRFLVRELTPRRAPASEPPASAANVAEPDAQLEAVDDQTPEPGVIARDERELLQSIVEFGDTLVREVMTPRPDIVAIRSDSSLEALRALFRDQEYSRIPVYLDNLDNILGFAFMKDFIRLTDAELNTRTIASILRPAHVVPETKRVSALLKDFQRRRVQSAIVVDEYGGTAGLVTIEDLLEEIVGEIRDEYDVETESVAEEQEGVFIVSGKTDIDEVAKRVGVTIQGQGFETLGGYLLAKLGRVPVVSEALEIDGLMIEVLEAERRRVTKVRIRRQAAVKVQTVKTTSEVLTTRESR